MNFLFLSLLACVVDEPSEEVAPKAQRSAKGAKGAKGKGKAFKAAKPFLPEGVAVSTFETAATPSKGKQAQQRSCNWFRWDGAGEKQLLASWDRGCPGKIDVAWSATGRTLVRLGPDLFAVQDGKRARLPGKKHYSGALRDFGFSSDNQVWIVTADDEVTAEAGKVMHADKALPVPAGVESPSLLHHYAWDEAKEAWLLITSKVVQADSPASELGLELGTRTGTKLHGVTGAESQPASEAQVAKLAEHAPEAEGAWKVTPTSHGTLAWFEGEKGPLNLLHEHDGVFAAVHTDMPKAGALSIEVRSQYVLITERGGKPRAYDLSTRSVIASSPMAKGVSLWPEGLTQGADEG